MAVELPNISSAVVVVSSGNAGSMRRAANTQLGLSDANCSFLEVDSIYTRDGERLVVRRVCEFYRGVWPWWRLADVIAGLVGLLRGESFSLLPKSGNVGGVVLFDGSLFDQVGVRQYRVLETLERKLSGYYFFPIVLSTDESVCRESMIHGARLTSGATENRDELRHRIQVALLRDKRASANARKLTLGSVLVSFFVVSLLAFLAGGLSKAGEDVYSYLKSACCVSPAVPGQPNHPSPP